jgi:hypothetical protein
MTLLEWVAKWGIPPQALHELIETSLHLNPNAVDTDIGEAAVQKQVRLTAARQGKYLWRNNRGAFQNEYGAWIRYGLANESKKIGDAWKSADLIGLETIFVTYEMVLEAMSKGLPGYMVGRFLSVEVKRRDWTHKGTLEDMAQSNWANLVNQNGGRALITNDTNAI